MPRVSLKKDSTVHLFSLFFGPTKTLKIHKKTHPDKILLSMKVCGDDIVLPSSFPWLPSVPFV